MWEGADPDELDDTVGGKTYTLVTNFLVFGKPLIVADDVDEAVYIRVKIHDYVVNHIKSMQQLMPTYSFLNPLGSSECESNIWLKDLNSSPKLSLLTDKDSIDLDKVRTMLFYNDSSSTIKTIHVGEKDCSRLFYPDGEPKDAGFTQIGDTTVLASSARLTEADITEDSSKTGTHAKLVKTYAADAVAFIDDGQSGIVSALSKSALLSKSAFSVQTASATSSFSIAVTGRAQPLLISPTGEKSGIDNGAPVNNIPGTEQSIGVDAGSITIESPDEGTYTVSMSGTHEEDYNIILEFVNADGGSAILSEHGFNHADTTSFTFTLDSASADKITVNHTPLPPTGLQADAVDSGGLKTTFTWTASTDLTVTGYNIYAKYEDEPYLAQIGTSVTNSFNTGNAWAENDTIVTSLYAVSAVKSDSTESFLSNMVQNDDRDHDGLTDAQETSLGTNLSNPDTDGDGLTDGEEYVKGTNPLLTDTDVDGYSDYAEVQAGSDPLDINSQPSVDISIDISLLSGWNLISLPVQPNDTSIDMCLNNVANMYNIVWSYESSEWMMNNPATPIFNTLDTMEAGKGYWIYMTAPGTLTVSGGAPTNTIQLVNGWNLVGYNSDTGMPIADVLASIDGKYISVWAFINNEWFFYAPENIFSSLETMEPGYGYWINTTEACTWTLP